MKRSVVLATLAAGLVVLAAFEAPGWASARSARTDSADAVAGAWVGKPHKCNVRNTLKNVFPSARTVAFSSRSAAHVADQRQPYWPGWCGGWWRSYEGYLGGGGGTENPFFRNPSVDVSVILYKTRREALSAAFGEVPGPIQVLADGVRMRSGVGTGGIEDEVVSQVGVVSVVRNVVVSSYGIWPPGVYSDPQEQAASVRIHARIHAAILRQRRQRGAF